MTQLSKVKNINTDKSCNLKNNRTKLNPTELYELFCYLCTEEVAHLQHKTALIIFPLHLQTITDKPYDKPAKLYTKTCMING